MLISEMAVVSLRYFIIKQEQNRSHKELYTNRFHASDFNFLYEEIYQEKRLKLELLYTKR